MKALVFAVILFFICMSIPSSTAFDNVKKSSMPVSNGNTLYVGGSGEGNYSKIQDAIDNASNGDTVFVYNGTYYENIVVDKTINLIGEDKNKTSIDGQGNGNVVEIYAQLTTLSGFSIKNNNNETLRDGIVIFSNNNIVINNKILNNSIGITVWGINNTFSYNKISENFKGLYVLNSSNNIIENIIYSNEGFGIDLGMSTCNIILKNEISNNRNGISLSYSDNNTISYNFIWNNSEGIPNYKSHNNNFSYNHIFLNEFDGIDLYESNKNIIYKNNFSNNRQSIKIYGSDNNVILCNNFYHNRLNPFFQKCNDTKWDGNYWDRPRNLPKLLFGLKGYFGLFPWLNFDRHPAKEPYEI